MKYSFENDKIENFKNNMIEYIQGFWINGPMPPRTWSTFERSEDLTNNAQEGYNSKFNKEVKESHPAVGIFMCHIKGEVAMAEDRVAKMMAGVKKPAQRTLYKELAKKRLQLTKNYLEDKVDGDRYAMGRFLSNI